jgi:N-acyl-L-homoserine lactone synthetase
LTVINIVSVYDLYLERILRHSGCRVDRLASPWVYDGLKTVAGLFEVTQTVIDEMREAAAVPGDVFADKYRSARLPAFWEQPHQVLSSDPLQGRRDA